MHFVYRVMSSSHIRVCENHIIAHGSAFVLTCLGFQLPNSNSWILMKFFYNNWEKQIQEAIHLIDRVFWAFMHYCKLPLTHVSSITQLFGKLALFPTQVWQPPSLPVGFKELQEQRPHLHVPLCHDPSTPYGICWKVCLKFLRGDRRIETLSKLH